MKKIINSTLTLITLLLLSVSSFANDHFILDSNDSLKFTIDYVKKEVMFYDISGSEGKAYLIGSFEQIGDGKYIVRREEGETCPAFVIDIWDARGKSLGRVQGTAIATVTYDESEAMGTAQKSCHEDFLGNYTL